MKRNRLFILGAATLGLLAASCGNSGDSKPQTGAETAGITEFEVNQTLLTGDRNYKVETDYGTAYLDIYTSIQWPEKLGANDLTVLRDSLLRFAYGDSVALPARKAIENYLADTGVVQGVKSAVAVDSMPADTMTYFNSSTASVLDLNEQLVTYKVVNSSYLGGAHPMTATIPFTYDFAQAKVLDFASIFKADVSVDSVMPIIKEALARQYSVSVSGLERAGFFVNNLNFAGRPYIADNTLYFHYDPYDIGPYAFGAIDVAVYPGEVDALLRPEAKALFDEGI